MAVWALRRVFYDWDEFRQRLIVEISGAQETLAFVPTMGFPARGRFHADVRGRAAILAGSLLVNQTEFEPS
jgi:hypothetical protein